MKTTMPVDMDRSQSFRDVFLRQNRYALDDRFVLRDGKTHPFAVICPGGGYSIVCSFIEGTPVARRLNELGISAFIVYYRVKKKARFPHPQEDLARAVREILGKRRCITSTRVITAYGVSRRAAIWRRASERRAWAMCTSRCPSRQPLCSAIRSSPWTRC